MELEVEIVLIHTQGALEEAGELDHASRLPLAQGELRQAYHVEYDGRGQNGVASLPDELHGHLVVHEPLEVDEIPCGLQVFQGFHVIDAHMGMQRVPQDIIALERDLDAQELKTLKTHPVYSYRIINRELQLSEEIAQIALQHHERWDGGGYPQGLKGTEILFEARIVSVADAFEAMVSERPWRNSMIGYEAMKSILSDNQRRFDPEIVTIFIRAMGLYPVGSLVLLSDGSIGRVISSSEEAPLRPEIIILINSAGREYKGDTGPAIDLLNNKNLFIARALDIKSLIEKTMSKSEKH